MTSDGPSVGSDPCRVLLVCEGNVCRSPAAQLLLEAALPVSLVLPVSAGLRARVGDPVAERTARLLRRRGVDTSGFRARALEDEMVVEADLVVAMTRAQRSAVVSRVPSALRRTWTLLDLATTLGHTGLSLTTDPDELLSARTDRTGDVPDPWGRGAGAHARTLEVVSAAVDRLVRSLDHEPV